MPKRLPLIECCTPLAGSSLSETEAAELERLFRALGDRHRVRILNVLVQAGEPVCVCELVPTLGLAQPTVSYHLKQLSDAGLIERERRGTFAYYGLVPGALERLRGLFAAPASGVDYVRFGSTARPARGSPGRERAAG
jgi:ArsR family transcriptional regulator